MSAGFTHLLGVDVGGTFTDITVVDLSSGRVTVAKELTTAANPAEGVARGVERTLARLEVGSGDLARVVHATTLGSNAVLEHKGARVGLLTTDGFEDILEIGRELRYDAYGLSARPPEPLVPRDLRRGVVERTLADGSVDTPLDERSLRASVRALRNGGAESVAICFLHSFRNAANEVAAESIVESEWPGVSVSVSARVAPVMREYERTSTTVIDAYIKPLFGRYLADLHGRMRATGLSSPLNVLLSDGSVAALETATKFPARLVESGPAAGVVAANWLLREDSAEGGNAVCFDMGGTTAKVAVVRNREVNQSHSFEVARRARFKPGSGYPIQAPSIQLLEVGAGGGSLVKVADGLITVGPESAGSEPGPACYGLGGERPTVTDANVVLGYLNPNAVFGERIEIDRDAAKEAIDRRCARPLGLPLIRAAAGIHEIVSEAMASAIRMHLLEQGLDPRRCELVAYGGSGPVHAHTLGEKLGCPRIRCPRAAGVFSAFGLLVASPGISLARSARMRLSAMDWDLVSAVYAEMVQEAQAALRAVGVDPSDVTWVREADMHYVGQGHSVTVPLPDEPTNPDPAAYHRRFSQAYPPEHRQELAEHDVEIDTWRLSAAASALATVSLAMDEVPMSPRAGRRDVYFKQIGDFVPAAVHRRADIAPGARYEGPAVIEDPDTTIVVGPESTFTTDAQATVIVYRPTHATNGRP